MQRTSEQFYQLVAELESDWQELQNLRQKHQRVTEKLESLPEPDEFDWAGLGYVLNCTYTAFESYFTRVAKFFGNRLADEHWHRDLLARMALSVPPVRPAVISQELHDLLSDLRGFRHVFRFVYTRKLRPKKLTELSDRVPSIYAAFEPAHTAFTTFLRDAAAKIQ